MTSRGDRDVYNNDKCPRCGAMYCAESMGPFPGCPVSPTHMVFCLACDHIDRIQAFWDAFDNPTE